MVYLLNRIFYWVRMTFQAIRNARNAWEPELKRLHDNLSKIEESLAGTDDCVVDIFNLEEKHEDRINALEEELTSTKAFITDLENRESKIFDTVKAENVEMRNRINWLVKELNTIKRVELKQLIMENEQSFEIEPPPNKGYNLRKGI